MDHLGIIAKYWAPGRVKTRLAVSVGRDVASQLARQFLVCLLRRLDSQADRRWVAHAPPEQSEIFRELAGPRWDTVPQSSGDLGQKMRGFFQHAFGQGADHVILIGSDSPTMPTTYVEHAFQLLRQFDVVLGPTLDGGYYLVGAARSVPPIFDRIAWSSTRVWQQTIQRLADCGIAHGCLPTWYDVDNVVGLRRLCDELEGLSPLPECFVELSAAVRAAL
jgi:rSAM/selenodomain-associated transferase 1